MNAICIAIVLGFLAAADAYGDSGLLGHYYQAGDLSGEPSVRLTPSICFGSSPERVASRSDSDMFPELSARWTGHVRIDHAGDWRFYADCQGGVRLWVNGEQLVDCCEAHLKTRDTATIKLQTGWAPIQLEYRKKPGNTQANAGLRLLFEGPETEATVIPASHLRASGFKGADVGHVRHRGSTTIDHASGRHTVVASGRDIQWKADSFHFASTSISGDASITARVLSVKHTDPFAKGGVMFRATSSPGSPNVVMEIEAAKGGEFQYRKSAEAHTTVGGRVSPSVATAPYWVRLERFGNTFIGSASPDGRAWTECGRVVVPMPERVLVGLAATSHNENASTIVEYDNVILSAEVITPSVAGTGVGGFIPLLTPETFDPATADGKDPSKFFSDTDEFYTFRGARWDTNAAKGGPGHDEDEGADSDEGDPVFRFTPDGSLRVLGIKATDDEQEFGYVSTEDHYRNYHLTLEYRWGNKKFRPRHARVRDSGLLYHVIGPDVVWPTCVETQIQEHDTGDFYFLGETSPPATATLGRAAGTVTVTNGGDRYMNGGEAIDTWKRVIKSSTVDWLDDWNRVEVMLEQDNATVAVNGVVVNRATNLRMKSADGMLVPLREGRIALQAEGAEIDYRNIAIKPLHATGGRGSCRVMLFQEQDTREPSEAPVKAIRRALTSLAETNGFDLDCVDDSRGVFNGDKLSTYAAIVWGGASGITLDDNERVALRKYIDSGGGFVGLHSAIACEEDWEWFGELIGTRSSDAGKPTLGTIRIGPDADARGGGLRMHHPAVDMLPTEWRRIDAWRRVPPSLPAGTNVLLTVDRGLPSDSPHPIAWWRDQGRGRSFYTSIGVTKSSYVEPLVLSHLLGGIEFAAGVGRMPPADAVRLFDGTDATAFVHSDDGSYPKWHIDDEGALAIAPGTGDLRTREAFTDYRLHLEFSVPATSAQTPEQTRGNSGVYLHDSYELQILDSYSERHPNPQTLGALYGVKSVDFSAALPAETWQVYDIEFKAPRFDASDKKVVPARLTAYLNGVLIHNDLKISGPTQGGSPEGPGARPIRLQDHDTNSRVRFRNIWIQPAL